MSKRCFSGTGRTVKQHRSHLIALQQTPKKFVFAQEVCLTDKFFQLPRSHASCQRGHALAIAVFRCFKKRHRSHLSVLEKPKCTVQGQLKQVGQKDSTSYGKKGKISALCWIRFASARLT